MEEAGRIGSNEEAEGMLEMLAVGTRVHYMCGRQVAQWRFKFALQLQLY